MANKVKDIGKRFEEKIAEKFRRYWGINDITKITRNLASGTYSAHFGDISFHLSPKPLLVVECKRYSSLELEQLIVNGVPSGWKTQLKNELEKAERILGERHLGIIVWGRPRKKEWVGIMNYTEHPRLSRYNLAGDMYFSAYALSIDNFLWVPLSEFLSKIKPIGR